MEQGWVYVLVNSSIPGMVKVGRTTRAPAERVAELSGATGVATPFVLAFEQAFADCIQAERDIHGELDKRGLRVASNREFFRGSAADIVRVVMEVAAVENTETAAIKPSPSAACLLEDGDQHRFGHGETLQDVTEAVRCYRLAAARGSTVALERLGSVYAQLRGGGQTHRRRAMRYLKVGAQRGNYYCYCEMAAMYAADGHVANFVKAWSLFFSHRAAAPCAEAEDSPARYIGALRRYLCACLDLQVGPQNMPELMANADAVMQALRTSLEDAAQATPAQRQLSGAMRWAYENLVPAPPRLSVQRRRWMPSWLMRGLAEAA